MIDTDRRGSKTASNQESLAKLSLPTVLIHGGLDQRASGDPVVQPLSQSVTYLAPVRSGVNFESDSKSVGNSQIVYPRHDNMPNADVIQRRLALLEGTEKALVLSSGMAATTCTMLALLRPGDHVVASSWLYGGTRLFLEKELAQFGVSTTFVNPTETRAWRRALQPNSRVLFLESPVNPTTRIPDLRPATSLARENGLALVVDSTFASPINLRPAEQGADVVIHSATKYLNGHHDVIAGVVCGSEAFIEEVCTKMSIWGQAPDPFAVWMLERGLKTLDVRVKRQNSNAMRVAEWATSHSAIRKVHYPGLASHPDHELARETFDGFGGMVAIEIDGGETAISRALSRMKLFLHATSLGGVDSLVSEPRFTSHQHFSHDQLAEIGIGEGFLRLSVGLEDADDLIDDLEQALS